MRISSLPACEPRTLRVRFHAAGAVLATVLSAAAPAVAQTACETGLREAGKSYDLGIFAAVPEQLAPCFQGRYSRTVLVEAYSLLARAYLAADELAKARQAVSDLLRTDPAYEPGPPPRFAQLVAEMRRAETTVEVTSVSKTRESLREAPATVVVVTADEIERRGYLDLEQVLHDLPGFDISNTRDTQYSTLFMRGFRSGTSNRNLFLLDGVEQGDLSTNLLYLSRQYALSNVDRVEAVYGPASTMYGANAFTGVISVITKEPEALIAEDKRLGLTVQAAAGGLHTRYADMTLAGKDASGSVSWSLTSRLYHDDVSDLSRFPEYSYDYSSVDYRDNLRITGDLALAFQSLHPCGASAYYACRFDAAGRLAAIELTDAGERLARQLDRQFIQQNHFAFSAPADDWLVYGKLKLANLVLGAELWRNYEGNAAIGSLFQSGHVTWAPRQTLLYAKYGRPLARELTFKVFIRYQQSGVDRSGTFFSVPRTYANTVLGIWNLVPPCIGPTRAEAPPLGCPSQPWTAATVFGDLSSQIRGELNLAYEPSPRFSLVGGFELWKSSIQSGFEQQETGPGGTPFPPIRPEQIEHTDLAAYTQAAYRLRPELKLVLAGRLNYNTISNRPGASGFGLLFSPRAAVIYTPAAGRLAFKAIYSEAFKDPTDAEKFGTIHFLDEIPSGGLVPEKVRNLELGAGWHPSEDLSLDAAAYEAHYSGLVNLRFVPGCDRPLALCLQWHNLDRFRTRGLQLDGRYRLGGAEITGNFTWTAPFQIDPKDVFGQPLRDGAGHPIHQLRVGDIAGQHASLGANRDLPAHLNADLRLRWVGTRPTGRLTTDAGNPLDRIGSYLEAQATVSYRGPIPGTTLQLIVDNLFGSTYFDPGTENPAIALPMVRRPGRTIFFRLITGLGRPARAVPST
jgi:outer membrane receptor for ferrienterochelin and colicins